MSRVGSHILTDNYVFYAETAARSNQMHVFGGTRGAMADPNQQGLIHSSLQRGVLSAVSAAKQLLIAVGLSKDFLFAAAEIRWFFALILHKIQLCYHASIADVSQHCTVKVSPLFVLVLFMLKA